MTSRDLASVSSLEDPVRRQLYEIVSSRSEPIARDEAAAAAGIGRPLAAYHLDKLVESGLLTASYQRLGGRTGPGAGRPAKLYARSEREFAVSVPPRDYELAARILARAFSDDRSRTGRAALNDAARLMGTELGRPRQAGDARELASVLTDHGYEPALRDAIIRLRNCPFHQLAEQHRELVCGMNLSLIGGLVSGLRLPDWRPVLDPRPGHCCVAIEKRQDGTS